MPAILGSLLRTPRLWRPRSLSRYFGVETSVEAHRPDFPYHRNLPLYARHGFQVTSEFVTHHGKGPRTWTLLRPAVGADARKRSG